MAAATLVRTGWAPVAAGSDGAGPGGPAAAWRITAADGPRRANPTIPPVPGRQDPRIPESRENACLSSFEHGSLTKR